MAVLVENMQDQVIVTDEMDRLMKEVVRGCLLKEQMEKPVEVSITLVDDARIQQINWEHRGKDMPTDVLSFPMLDLEDGRLIQAVGDYNLEDGLLILGDIVISLQRVTSQAGEYGHSFQRELGFLVSHGMFHLLGYDHETAEDEIVMMNKQEQVLEKMALLR